MARSRLRKPAKIIKGNMNKVVIGLGFGDEGKGLVVDYLCSQSPKSLVIRFSGGHQCGHTVYTDTTNHVFSNFGSGTLRGAETYWLKFCTVEPIGLLNELEILKQKGIEPKIYIDERCPITTPYDIHFNRETENFNAHGSCGVGFGATIEREEKHYSLTFSDLRYPDVFNAKINIIGDFYNFSFEDKNYLDEFIQSCEDIVDKYHNNIWSTRGSPDKWYGNKHQNYIFEGSQGLLLDQNHGFFPNVTRANTGCKNLDNLINMFDDNEIYLVTRAYQTRHGNGFMTNEDKPHKIKINPEETNKQNKYQGKFRRSLLDLSLIEYALHKEDVPSWYKKFLVITCLDHIENEYRFTYKGHIVNCGSESKFVNKIQNILKINDIFLSHSNNSKNMVKYNEKVMVG